MAKSPFTPPHPGAPAASTQQPDKPFGAAPTPLLPGERAQLGSTRPVPDAPGERTPQPLPPVAAAVADAMDHASSAEMAARRLSPPLPGAQPTALPPVRPFGTTATDAPPPVAADPMFDRRFTIDRLLTHPVPEVRQRAEEARAALHHGAADAGLKMRAAIDVARAREASR